MHVVNVVRYRPLSRLLLATIIGGGLLAAGSAKAQLTSRDIDDLKVRGDKEGWTFTITENDATKYSLDQLCGTRLPANYVKPRGHIDNSLGTASLPPAFDWRTTSGLPPIRNQGGCGSCWAFSTVGALECAIKVYEGQVVNLSEQWLVSCNRSGWGCAGGWLAFDYFLNTPDRCGGIGAVMETSFPYSGTNGYCGCPYPHEYKIDNWAFIGGEWEVPSVPALKQAIMDHGPISVCVTANGAMQGYGGGIFNACSSDPINHAVVLVGWDDNQGPNGVWIMRNSWGTNWGEGGYMRIAYNCSNIGFGAAYIEYGGVGFVADTRFGPGPDTVNFTGTTTREVTAWNWELGDGTTSTDRNPTHAYAPGCYDVKLTVQTPTGTYAGTKSEYIWLYADSLVVDKAVACVGKTVRINVNAHNCVPVAMLRIPFTWAGTPGPVLDSVSIVGTRSAGASLSMTNDDTRINKRQSYQIDFSSRAPDFALPVGDGPVLSLYFRVGSNVPNGSILPIKVLAYGYQSPTFSVEPGDFTPEIVEGYISLCLAGDVNDDGFGPDIADLSAMIDFLYLGGHQPAFLAKADLDGAAGVDISDMTALISYLYLNGPRLNCGL